jgi:hypothetical protein
MSLEPEMNVTADAARKAKKDIKNAKERARRAAKKAAVQMAKDLQATATVIGSPEITQVDAQASQARTARDAAIKAGPAPVVEPAPPPAGPEMAPAVAQIGGGKPARKPMTEEARKALLIQLAAARAKRNPSAARR